MKKRIRLSESDLSNMVKNVLRNVMNEEINEPLNQSVNIDGLVKANSQLEPAVDALIELCSKAVDLSRRWSNDDKTTSLYLYGLECMRDIKRRFNTDM